MRSIPRSASVLLCGLAVSALLNGTADRGSLLTVFGAPSTTPTIIEPESSASASAALVLDQGAFALVHASPALSHATGAGVSIALLDGGFDLRHAFLANASIGAQWDAFDEDGYAQDLGNGEDDDSDGLTDSIVGHGTATAGLIAALAPGATILPIRVLDDEGRGSPAALARAIDRAVYWNVDIISMSAVAPEMTTQLANSITAAHDAGITIVVAAGDDPAGPFNAQFLSDRAIDVGAVDGNLGVADFSPNGTLVDIFAPGVSVVVPLGGSIPDSYATWSGTSFSCPIVAAAAALVKEGHPTYTPTQIRGWLMNSINTVTGANPASRGSVDLLESCDDQ